MKQHGSHKEFLQRWRAAAYGTFLSDLNSRNRYAIENRWGDDVYIAHWWIVNKPYPVREDMLGMAVFVEDADLNVAEVLLVRFRESREDMHEFERRVDQEVEDLVRMKVQEGKNVV